MPIGKFQTLRATTSRTHAAPVTAPAISSQENGTHPTARPATSPTVVRMNNAAATRTPTVRRADAAVADRGSPTVRLPRPADGLLAPPDQLVLPVGHEDGPHP